MFGYLEDLGWRDKNETYHRGFRLFSSIPGLKVELIGAETSRDLFTRHRNKFNEAPPSFFIMISSESSYEFIGIDTLSSGNDDERSEWSPNKHYLEGWESILNEIISEH